jgi:hypothetical protein
VAKTLDEAFDEIFVDVQKITTKAVSNAAKKAQNDIMIEADNYLREYYSNYKPKRYKRTYQLEDTIHPIFKDKSSNGNSVIEIGVRYIPSGEYSSNSKYHQAGDKWKDITERDNSPNNGIPQPEWILDNFLHGEHGGYQRDFNATYTLMREFLETELQDRLNQYIYSELLDAIVSKL